MAVLPNPRCSYRITKTKYLATAFTGEGSWRTGGRWTSKIIPMVYTAGSPSLAQLEMLVHLNKSALLNAYSLIETTFDDKLVTWLTIDKLPTDWQMSPALASCQVIGDQWANDLATPILAVPSVIQPKELNFLLNPLHTDFTGIVIGDAEPIVFDPRLKA